MSKTALGERKTFSYVSGVGFNRFKEVVGVLYISKSVAGPASTGLWSVRPVAVVNAIATSLVLVRGLTVSLGPPVPGRLTNHGTFPRSPL